MWVPRFIIYLKLNFNYNFKEVFFMTKVYFSKSNPFSIFDEVENLIFQRPFYDMSPIKWLKTEDGYVGYCITTGIKPESVEVKPEDGYIKVKGFTKDEEFNEEFSQSFNVKVNPDIYKNIEELTYTSENGVTKIYLKVKNNDKEIKVKRI
jgi:HSP20 family molecular chaperone IbpA